MMQKRHFVLVSVFTLATAATASAEDAAKLTLRKGDHVSIIGNDLAERMQHDGWLETYLQTRFPKLELSFRNLAFSGDELTLRLRSAGFGSPDEWLTRTKADVVFAFFGYNESFGGENGLPKFEKDLDEFIKHTLGQKYNGKRAPRLVLFSPIAREERDVPNWPASGALYNMQIESYTKAMARVAAANNVPFVDLFEPMKRRYVIAAAPKPIEATKPNVEKPKPLTINGIHLNEIGNRVLAALIDLILFGDEPVPGSQEQTLEKLRRAVVDKNEIWFLRYRTLDGYNVYGGRSYEKYNGQTNRVVMDREMEIIDVMTANRDKRIWAIAQGGDLKVDDSNTPPFIPTETNKPGPLPGGKHVFLDGEEAIKKMTLAKGLKIQLFASEKEWPELEKPVQMQFDSKGRLWVAVWPSYPHWKPKDELNDKILIFEDTKGTGKADKMTVFADHLNCPTGFEFYDGGVLVAQAPDLVFLKDTKGDGKADLRVRLVSGLDSADSHHTANSFAFDPGGALYFQEGTFHHTQVESPYGPPVRCANGGVFRYEPRTQKFDAYVSHPFANPHGHVWNRWGQDIVFDGTMSTPHDGALFSGHVDFPNKHRTPPLVYKPRTRPCPGVEYLTSRHFPESFQGNLLVANVIGFQGILRYQIDEKDSSFTGTELEPIVSSTDPNFRPSDLKIGPDGALYFIDWQNPIIGHLQHHIRDPNRDHTHGRIYKITFQGRDLLKPPQIDGAPIEKLLDLLKEPEERVRYRARIELWSRDTKQVLEAANKWLDRLAKDDPDYERLVLEVLWLHQAHNVVNAELLNRVLASPEFRARAAATRVLCYWRDRVPDALGLLKKLAADPYPRVRLEAVRAASFFTVPEAVEVPIISAEQATDPYIEFVRAETMRTLDPYVKKAIAEGKEIALTSAAGARFFLKNVSTDDLLKMKRSQGVFLELLFRKGVRDEFRREALAGLAMLDKKSEARVLVDAIRGQDEQQNSQDESVAYDLVRLLTSRGESELAAVRGDVEKMATGATSPTARQLGFVALIAADGNVDKAWSLAEKSIGSLRDLVSAMPLIRDPGQRAALYPKVEPLLHGLPKPLATSKGNGKQVSGRYVRIELPGKQRTLTLAEVEVYSGGKNVARKGKASQKNTAHGGDAGKAIDGNRSGASADGGQSHTEEDTENPWWEVDLGGEYPIDSLHIYNRTDGFLRTRLHGFSLEVLDGRRQVVFEKKDQPAPEVKVVYDVGGDSPERTVRRAAMNAVIAVRGKESEAFKALSQFVRDEQDRPAAVQAILRIPADQWPKEEAKPLLDTLLGVIRKLPVKERTTPAALDAIQLADALASLLPISEAKAIRKELGELGVPVLRLGTVPDQMLFDKERLVVRAGKPVEFLFENTDLMPHNFVIAQPGALEEVGTLAEASGTQPGAAERHYVPASPKVLLSSKLLQPRDSQKLAFTAPAKPGVYPYVCTYPGHWRRMFGALYVVENLDEYRADPESYLAKHPLPAADPLLKFNRPRKEWKLEELASAVEPMENGRSFANGKQIFTVANCIACHKFGGAGTEFGPDLTKIDPKQQSAIEILKDILDPSFRINEKYQSYVFALDSGKTVTGLVLEEKGDIIKVIENPLAKAEPIVLKKSEIAAREKSPTSLMPKGLLDKLTREEILDLIAYVASKGDAKHKWFQGGGHEHH
jgi:putative heme-binding domain-containing protein